MEELKEYRGRYLVVGVGNEPEDDTFALVNTREFAKKEYERLKKDPKILFGYLARIENAYRAI